MGIQAYDSEGNMVMIENPKPTKIFRIVDLRNKDDHKMEFLGWERAAAQRYPIIFLGCYLALRQGGSLEYSYLRPPVEYRSCGCPR